MRVCIAAVVLLLVSHALAGPVAIRVATFNVEDVRTADLRDPSNERLRHLAEIIQRIRPNVLLLNEITYDMPGGPGCAEDHQPGRNATLFVKNFLETPQKPGLRAISYATFQQRPNTGMPSGMDLDQDGEVVTSYDNDLDAEENTRFGNDAWGFGRFPGQYGMALLVDPRLEIVEDEIHTFRLLPWSYMPGAFRPRTPEGDHWHDDETWKKLRLSSKSHWDVPVRLPNGATLHVLCSHPTPPAFDGDEKRNARRNHDEIRFWADYVDRKLWIVDDEGATCGVRWDRPFVILGDLNADPDEGTSFKDPIGTVLKSSDRINLDHVPTGPATSDLSPDDTASWGMRVDYVLPSTDLSVRRSGVWRDAPDGAEFPSDHFPVWVDLVVPDPK